MNAPWYTYILMLLVVISAGIVTFFAALDPEGRGERLFTRSLIVSFVAVAILVVLITLDLARWISTL